jgi:hypothetical protein
MLIKQIIASQKNYWRTLQEYSDYFEKTLKDNAPINTGKLAESINSEVGFDANGNVDLDITMNEYGLFINAGVNGVTISRGSIYSYRDKKPPISALQGWAKSKGINVYALQNSIYNKGIQKQPFIDESVSDVNVVRMADDLANNLWNDYSEIENNININR